MRCFIVCLLSVIWIGQTMAGAETTPVPTQERHNVALRSVRVDAAARTVSATGWVNQVSGPIELLACGPGGKTHESVFVLEVNPVDLQAGLLLLGLKPGKPLPMLGVGPPTGPGLELWVDWEADGSNFSKRAERFVTRVDTREVLPEILWVFSGSVTEDGQFKALVEESLVATYWDPWPIANISLPCGSNDEALIVNTSAVPVLHTPIEFRFKVPDEP